MKKVVNDNELKEKMRDAINMLCNTVKMTLGPSGRNVIIDHSSFNPFITNDGVTIAENIESDDQVINTILKLAKEASIKTNEKAGDGTTTTLVLLQSIFNNGLKLIEDGVSPIVLKRELDLALEIIIEKIKNISRKPNDKELKNIACVSANDKEIGNNISKAFLKVKDKSAILVKEGTEEKTLVNYINGYVMNTNIASNYFFKDFKELEFNNSYILLIDNYLDNLNDIANVINYVISEEKNLIILARDYNNELINEVLSLNIDSNYNIILLKNPEYGFRQNSILKDVESITKAKIVEKLDYVDCNYLGLVKNIKINIEEVVLSFECNSDIKRRINDLKIEKNICKNSLDLDFVNKRLAMFDKGMVEILVGDKTTTARREKKMRYDDSLCSISSAVNGVLLGSGISLLEISNKMNSDSYGNNILKESLKEPFKQIMFNAGVNYKDILIEIEKKNYKVVYNLNTLKYEDVFDTEIVDSTDVIINAISSAISIASMLLTTTSIIINEYQNNLNKVNEYNEL